MQELIKLCLLSPTSTAPHVQKNFQISAVIHVDLSFGHDIPCVDQLTAVNSVGGLDTRPSSLYGQIEPGFFFLTLATQVSFISKMITGMSLWIPQMWV